MNAELGIRKAGKKEDGKIRRWEKALLRDRVKGKWGVWKVERKIMNTEFFRGWLNYTKLPFSHDFLSVILDGPAD